MNITIRSLNRLTKQHYDLLLEADPYKKLVNTYVKRSFCFEATVNDSLLGVLVILPTHPETLEIVNISVISSQRNKGIGKQLIAFAKNYAQNNLYKCLEIGTGTSSFGQLYLYQKCGFRIVGVDQDFFTLHYDKKIIENNIILKDMLRLRMIVNP